MPTVFDGVPRLENFDIQQNRDLENRRRGGAIQPVRPGHGGPSLAGEEPAVEADGNRPVPEQGVVEFAEAERSTAAAPLILAPHRIRNCARSLTSGSRAAFSITVTPSAKVAAIMRFSVPVTDGRSR